MTSNNPELQCLISKIKKLSKAEKIRFLELVYLEHLVEDPQNGTTFDYDVLDALKSLEMVYN